MHTHMHTHTHAHTHTHTHTHRNSNWADESTSPHVLRPIPILIIGELEQGSKWVKLKYLRVSNMGTCTCCETYRMALLVYLLCWQHTAIQCNKRPVKLQIPSTENLLRFRVSTADSNKTVVHMQPLLSPQYKSIACVLGIQEHIHACASESGIACIGTFVVQYRVNASMHQIDV